GLLAAIQYPNGEQERKEFDEPAVMIPDLLEKWLRDKLPNVFRRDKMRRQERAALPFEMVREAVVNALIHRDYDIRQAKCQLAVTTDTITVRSPGGPLPPITLEQLRVFTAPMLSRNPELHYVFSRMGMAEEMGFGLKSLKNRAEQLGLPLPRYSWEDPYLVLTLYRSPEAAQRALAPDALESLSTAERKGWQWLTTQETVTAIGYAAALGIPKRTALNHLKHFAGLGLLRRIGTGPSTKYEISGP
ncbi:MAG TPA: ATP-binding protein, partial [Desulfomonilaceae bacterium]|nr:ATP-binding protein [Desulfomonilaceae bacterium]